MKQTVPKVQQSNLTGLGLLPGLLEIDPPVNDQTEFPLAGSNPGTLHEQTVREEHDQSETETGSGFFLGEIDEEREREERERWMRLFLKKKVDPRVKDLRRIQKVGFYLGPELPTFFHIFLLNLVDIRSWMFRV
ncbi:hypothetical protein OSB04_024450 [Centaurea solstitialis]|uniref:Uncharacterized protein n=1 Tax=Centaurea solstitialis TaxID=347529 RepID=A0AA38STM4_9ASTR|nr:hypothetical protein OSB04_024450 [Centaurea solstitialis]